VTAAVRRAGHDGWAELLDALRAEWTKLRTVPDTGRLLVGAVAVTVALSALAASVATCPPAGCGLDPAKIMLTGVQLGQAVVAVLAVLVIAGEYGTGMIGVTMAALPRRWTVLAAKAVTVGGVVLGAAIVAVLGSVLAGRLGLRGSGVPVQSLTDGPLARAAVGSVLYLVLIALLGLGVAAVVRDAAAAVGVVLGLLYLFPILLQAVADPDWQEKIRQLAPMEAGLAVQATRQLADLPIGPWQGLGVLAVWAAGALLAGGLLLRLRDA
jgi:ABC-2 type transport system permease protein